MFKFTDAHYKTLKRAIERGADLDDVRALMEAKGYRSRREVFRAMFTKVRGKTLWERFWSRAGRLGDDDCWLWPGTWAATVDGRFHAPNRLAWELVHGDVPEGFCVLHTCTSGACVNPNHLRLGKPSDNIRSQIERGVHPSCFHVMKQSDRDEAVRRLDDGASVRDVAALFNVSERAVRAWRKPVNSAEKAARAQERLSAQRSLFKQPYDHRAHLSAVAKRRANEKRARAS